MSIEVAGKNKAGEVESVVMQEGEKVAVVEKGANVCHWGH